MSLGSRPRTTTQLAHSAEEASLSSTFKKEREEEELEEEWYKSFSLSRIDRVGGSVPCLRKAKSLELETFLLFLCEEEGICWRVELKRRSGEETSTVTD